MELTHMYGPSPVAAQLAALFCIVWPICTFTFIHRRERSPVPILAMLIPAAVGLCATWVVLAPKSTVEPLYLAFFGLLGGAPVAVVAAIKLHRPTVDRPTALGTILLIAGVAAAMHAPPSKPLALTAALATAALGIALFVRLVRIVRRRVAPPALPFGVPAVILAILGMMGMIWDHARALLAS